MGASGTSARTLAIVRVPPQRTPFFPHIEGTNDLNNGTAARAPLLSRVAHALEHHPKHFTALFAALLLGGGGGAFAVATFDPEPAQVVVRNVVEPVQALPVEPQLRALDLHELRLFRSETVRATDTVESLLARLGIADAEAAAFLRKHAVFRNQFIARPGRSVTAEATEGHQLQSLTARWAPQDDGTFRRLVIQRSEDGPGFDSKVETAPLVATSRLGSATLRSSLFGAADEAGIPDRVVSQIVEILSGDIDFHRDLRSGDRFNVVYEALEADGEPMRTGRILSLEFVNQGKAHQALWYQEPGHKPGYYSLDGRSLDTSYLSSPVEFSRVSSGFKMRMHPVFHQWKAHLGVDYAAEVGTPVRTVGDGTVEFAGEQNGFGNVVIVKHNNTEQTVYAHLSAISVRTGEEIRQGQNVGRVGQTGWATGPHLHFEFRINGVHQDPSVMAHRGGNPAISAEARPQFLRVARSMKAQLEVASLATIARAD
jgi:murein DD-endopeptidase MepM/ murein hydrolase activator NlpD